jgi:transcriptional regulator with XRE-family HTH domain
MRSFEHIAKLIKEKRVGHPKGFSQTDLSHLLGYKNGQFISNVERGLCSIPLKMLSKVCHILQINRDEMKIAIMKDYDRTIELHLNLPPDQEVRGAFDTED